MFEFEHLPSKIEYFSENKANYFFVQIIFLLYFILFKSFFVTQLCLFDT
jgi:hypothetical protein